MKGTRVNRERESRRVSEGVGDGLSFVETDKVSKRARRTSEDVGDGLSFVEIDNVSKRARRTSEDVGNWPPQVLQPRKS